MYIILRKLSKVVQLAVQTYADAQLRRREMSNVRRTKRMRRTSRAFKRT
jgi:hypothetical protein